MSPVTLHLIRAWVEQMEPATGRAAARLETYRAALDTAVPEGWVRILLAS
jgi:hypothetical protein